jgi:serine/threonine-protein phosphatase 2A regulatory subunit A
VRLATIELLPLVSTQLGVEYFEAQLLSKCLAALTDSVFCVRSAAVEVVRQLTIEFGAEWSKAQLIPQVMQVAVDGGT